MLNNIAEQCLQDSKRWFPGHTNNSLVHHALSLGGEVGEIQNIIKKIDRGDLNLNDAATAHHLREEVADAFIYLENLVGILRIDLYKAFCEKRAINEKRWGNK